MCTGTCDILHGCASVRALLIGVSFTCQFVQPGICGVIFSCMCGQRGTTTVSVFADTLSAEQTHEDCVTRECVSLAAFILGSSEAALHNWSRAQHQISRKQHHLAPCWKHPEKFKYSEISCPPKVISLFVGTSTSWWISPGWANPHKRGRDNDAPCDITKGWLCELCFSTHLKSHYDSVLWNSSKTCDLILFLTETQNANTTKSNITKETPAPLKHEQDYDESYRVCFFICSKLFSNSKKKQAEEEPIEVISSTWLYWHAHLVHLAKDHGRLEPVPDDIREGGGVHPGQAKQPRSELHLQTESAAHLSDTSLKSGRRLKNWLRRERERTRKAAMTEKWNVIWPSGSWPAMLPTVSAHITKVTAANVWGWSWLGWFCLFDNSTSPPAVFRFFSSLQCWTTSAARAKPNMGEMPSKLTCHSTSFLQTHVKQQVTAAAKTCSSENALRVPKPTVRTLSWVPPAKADIIRGRRPCSHIRTQK